MIAQRITARRLIDLLGSWQTDGHTYRELSESIALLVRDGVLSAGTALPAERPLAEALRVSRTTVSASYQRLRETGIAVSRRGSGTVIRSQRAESMDAGGADEGPVIDLSQASPPAWAGLAALGAGVFEEFPGLFHRGGFDTIGRADLRRTIADRYGMRGLPTAPEQIMVTLGAQHAIHLIARTLLSRGDRALIETPSYPHAREALTATGALVAELPVGRAQWDVPSALDIARRVSPRLAYLIPDHHNPTGGSMPPDLRTRLIDVLSAQGAYTVVDETTAELTLDGPRFVTPFAASAGQPFQQDSILTVGSLGKSVWGGLRIGWIRAAPDLIARLEAQRRIGDLGTGEWEQALAVRALEHYDEILLDRSRELTARYRLLTDRLSTRLPAWRPSEAFGGVCTWVDLGRASSSALCRGAAGLGVRLAPGPRFGSPGVFERFVRLPFTAPEAHLVQAVDVLATVWERNPRAIADAPREGSVV